MQAVSTAVASNARRIALGALTAIILLACGLRLAVGAQPTSPAKPYDWQLVQGADGNIEVRVQNHMMFPFTFGIVCRAADGRATEPVAVAVPAKSTATASIPSGRAMPASCDTTGAVGFAATAVQLAPLRLPISIANGICVGQAYPAQRTHTGAERFAVDFLTDVGMPVVAARGGIVFETVTRHTKGGSDPQFLWEANYVKIVHDDGSVALYAHLQTNTVAVAVGQRVVPGQLLARSGATGYVAGPHLHFMVSSPVITMAPTTLKPVAYYQSINPVFEFSGKAESVFDGSYVTHSDHFARHERRSDACRETTLGGRR
jgi:hypothetical protein